MPMGSIDRYVFRTILSAFVLILLSLTAVIWTTQILQRIDIITNQGQTTWRSSGSPAGWCRS